MKKTSISAIIALSFYLTFCNASGLERYKGHYSLSIIDKHGLSDGQNGYFKTKPSEVFSTKMPASIKFNVDKNNPNYIFEFAIIEDTKENYTGRFRLLKKSPIKDMSPESIFESDFKGKLNTKNDIQMTNDLGYKLSFTLNLDKIFTKKELVERFKKLKAQQESKEKTDIN